jgi:hypothetical protein
LDRQAATCLFQLISERYERGSMILTSNKSYGEWGTIFQDNAIASAILDRLLHHSRTINIKGDSYRLKERRKYAALSNAGDDVPRLISSRHYFATQVEEVAGTPVGEDYWKHVEHKVFQLERMWKERAWGTCCCTTNRVAVDV